MAQQEEIVWVVGHKNPDTDSICAAVAYAYLKNQTALVLRSPGGSRMWVRRSRILIIARRMVSVVIIP